MTMLADKFSKLVAGLEAENNESWVGWVEERNPTNKTLGFVRLRSA
jgi:hypothetical protein